MCFPRPKIEFRPGDVQYVNAPVVRVTRPSQHAVNCKSCGAGGERGITCSYCRQPLMRFPSPSLEGL